MPSSPVSEQATEQQPPAAPRPPDAELDERYAQLDDRYKRALADLDNFRKRSARTAATQVEEAREAIARDWLEAVDSVERALDAGTPDDPLFEGLRAVLAQMESIVERQGLRRFGAPGEPFDPERHEAVAVREDPQTPDRTIAGVVRPGYEAGDRVVRPAQVVVARAPAGE
jgi:molecular chaperone GrpE